MKVSQQNCRSWVSVVFLVAVFISSADVIGAEYLDGDVRISGFVRSQVAVSTTSDRNTANAALGKADDHDLNLAKVWGVLDIDYRPRLARDAFLDDFHIFTRLRFGYDATQDLGGGLDGYDAFPATNGLDDRWTMLNASNDRSSAEIWELFADFKKQDLWVRIGRQNIVWGESDGVRLLDIVNPLDNSWHPFEGGGELFEHRRIPTWMVRATYNLPIKGLSLDGFINPGDFVPTIQADIGAPWNVNPLPRGDALALVPPGTFLIDDDTNDKRGDTQWGIRLLGEVGNFNYTLNYLSLIDQDGVISTQGVVPIFAPSPPAPPFTLVAVLPVLVNQHERLDILGASFNFNSESLAAVLRGEMTYTFDKPFAASPPPSNPPWLSFGEVERDEWKIMLGIDRPTFVFSKSRSMNISAQVIYTRRETVDINTDINGSAARKDETQFSLLLSQPVNNDQLYFEFFGLYDLDDGYWWQPQIRWQPGNNWRVWAYYNMFGGAEDRSIAVFDYADEINVAISYQF